MPVSLTAHSQVSGHAGTIVRVITKLAAYQVWVTEDDVSIRQGGRELISLSRSESIVLNDPDLSAEGAASIAVLFFEESNQ